MYYPPVPVQVILLGDTNKAALYIKMARNYLFKLARGAKLGGYKTANQTYTKRGAYTIRLTLNYNMSRIEVYVPAGQKPRKKVCYWECQAYSFPCLVFAVITEVYDKVDTCTSTYKVTTCIEPKMNALEGYTIYSFGHVLYEVGQFVLLGPTPSSTKNLKCCSDSSPLFQWLLVDAVDNTKLVPGALSIYPLHLYEGMVELWKQQVCKYV
jgi:hypothetical protein